MGIRLRRDDGAIRPLFAIGCAFNEDDIRIAISPHGSRCQDGAFVHDGTLGTAGENTAPDDTNALTAPYSEDDIYTVCYRI